MRLEQGNGQTRTPSKCRTRSALDSALAAVCQLWDAAVGGLSCSSNSHDLSRIHSPQTGRATLSQSGVRVVPLSLSTRRRGSLGTAPWRVWVRYHHGDWSVALWRAPQHPRNPSTLGETRGEHRPAHGHRSAGTL